MAAYIRFLLLFFASGVAFADGYSAASVLGPWVEEKPLPIPLHSHAMIAIGDFMFIIGGKTRGDVPVPDVMYSRINEDGSLAGWQKTESLPLTLEGHAVVASGNRIYVIAERDHSGNRKRNVKPETVTYIGAVENDGAILKWTPTAALPTEARYYGKAICCDRFIYYIGGRHCRMIFRSEIRKDGTLSPWTPAGHMKFIRSHFDVAAIGKYVYALGGRSITDPIETVLVTDWRQDGSFGPWTLARTLPVACFSMATAQYRDILFCIGGIDGSKRVSNIWRTKSKADGTLGKWQQDRPFPVPVSSGATVVFKDTLYYSGGTTAAPTADSRYQIMTNVYITKLILDNTKAI